jgi:hypothetical protein
MLQRNASGEEDLRNVEYYCSIKEILFVDEQMKETMEIQLLSDFSRRKV